LHSKVKNVVNNQHTIDNKTTLSLKDLHTKQKGSNAQTKHQNVWFVNPISLKRLKANKNIAFASHCCFN